ACPRTSSAPSTPNAPSSSARSSPTTWPTPSPRSAPTSSATPPACTSPSTPASPPPSCAELMARFAAVDIGASGGRVIAGTVTDDRALDIEVVHRFRNGAAERDGHLRWDFAHLCAEVETGLEAIPDAASIGISTWGVDYGR